MKKNKKTAALLREEGGAAMVIVAVSLAMILGCAALVVDLGNLFRHKVRLQNGVDNAVIAAAAELPVTGTDANKADVIAVVEANLSDNGLDPEMLTLSYEWESVYCSTLYTDTLRVTASEGVGFGFARIFGTDSGRVSATAKATASAQPVRSTLHAFAICIEQESFERQIDLDNVHIGDTVNIKITTGSSTMTSTVTNPTVNSKKTFTMGVMRLVPSGYEKQYYSDDLIGRSAADPIFFQYGYWQYTSNSYGYWSSGTDTQYGLSVGDTRTLETSPSIIQNGIDGVEWRIDACGDGTYGCGSDCSWEKHLNTCPRIALLPVIDLDTTTTWSGKTSTTTYTATVQYFVPIWIESITQNSSTSATITARYIEGYREISDVPVVGGEITASNAFVAGDYDFILSE